MTIGFQQLALDAPEGPFGDIFEPEADSPDEADGVGVDLLAEVSRVIRPLIDALLSGDWLDEDPPLPAVELVFKVD